MTIRVSTSGLNSGLSDAINQKYGDFFRKQSQITSEKRHLARSDSPSETSDAAYMTRVQDFDAQWGHNINLGLNWTKLTDGELTRQIEQVQRIQELAVRGGDSTLAAEDLHEIGVEIDSILNDLVSIANKKYEDNYLFGGTHSDQPPLTITRDANGDITAVDATHVDGGGNPLALRNREIQTSDATTQLYGRTAVGPDGLYIDTNTGNNIFTGMINLRDELLAGNNSSVASKTSVKEGMNNLLSNVVRNGIEQKQFENIADGLVDKNLTTRNLLSDLQDTDLPKTLTELSQIEASLQATMQLAARLSQFSLTNFI